jgi:sialic acid synthase SpsE
MLRIKSLMDLALKVYGTGELKMSKSEMATASLGAMKKVIVAKHDIKKGEKLSPDNLWFKRTPEGSHIKQYQFQQLIGLETEVDIEKDQVINFNDLKQEVKKTNVASFTRVSAQSAK